MRICLKTHAKRGEIESIPVLLQDRLPANISSPCDLMCSLHVEACADYYLVTLNVCGKLDIICQRCLHVFEHEYSNQTKLAVCTREEVAGRLMDDFDCVVACDNQIELIELVTDEIHLYSPEKHLEIADCSSEISRYIRDKS